MDKRYTNCTRCELCGTADIIYGSTFMEYSILLRLLSAPLATMGMGLMAATIIKAKGIHINTKVILFVLCISAIICNTGITVDCLYKFFISNVMPDYMQCDFQVFSPQYGLVIRHVEMLGAMCLSTSSSALAVERTVATIYYRNYSQKPTLGSILVVVQVLLSLIPIWNIRLPKQMYPYSPPELHDYKLYHFISIWLTISNVLAFLIFIILWIINHYRQKIIGSSHFQVVLARYNLNENMSTTRLMAPIVVVINVLVFLAELILLFSTPRYDEDTVVTHQVLNSVIDYSFYPELQLTLIPILLILLILMLLTQSNTLRNHFLLVSNLSICFPVKVHSTDSRSTSESSSSEGYSGRIHWNSQIDGLSITPQVSKY